MYLVEPPDSSQNNTVLEFLHVVAMPLNNRWVSGSIIHHFIIWFQFQRTLREVLELYGGFRFSRPSLCTVEGRGWPGGCSASRSLSMVADSSMYITAMGESGFKASQRPSLRLNQIRYTASIDWHDLRIVLACWSRGELLVSRYSILSAENLGASGSNRQTFRVRATEFCD